MLKFAPWLILLILLSPVAAGLAWTILPAFGRLPALGREAPGLAPWKSLLELPGLWTSVRLSLATGLGTTLISLAIVIGFCSAWHGTRAFRAMRRALSPLLAAPHSAVAFGIAFLLAPSGWLMRLLSPWATGFERPPDWLIVHDPMGLSLMAGLIAKETPFLFLVTLAAMGQADADRAYCVARTLGYRPMTAWLKAVFPRVYRQIRLPVIAVLAFGVSVVVVAIVLGPGTPATLAARLVRMFHDPDLELRLVASAGALLQCGVTLAAVGAWWALERIVARAGIRWAVRGDRGRPRRILRWTTAGVMTLCVVLVLAAMMSMALWSVAASWRFPSAWPAEFSLRGWTAHVETLREPLTNTLVAGLVSTSAALCLAVALLEREARSGRRSWVGSRGFIYVPLVLPQIAFLFVRAHLDGRWVALIWCHLLFVFPYVFLTLADPYRAWDERYQRTALCLGATPWRAFARVKLPMLLRAICASAAVGFSVSVSLYLPTLFAGAGRFPTLTTEAVALASSGDYRLIGAHATLQMALPCAAFALAGFLPGWRFRNRRGMQVSS
jgi:putative thiamine transport system permease protein